MIINFEKEKAIFLFIKKELDAQGISLEESDESTEILQDFVDDLLESYIFSKNSNIEYGLSSGIPL